ncbi:MAG: multidrug effflux MFS transporter [Coxiellaceae bacterium]|nr:multidrug effflux MFS transporter [Coxiellaceae bacterium]
MSSIRQDLPIFAVIIFMIIGAFMGIDIHLASMPHIQVFMHTNQEHMQQSVSFFLIGMGASLFFYGPLSDKYGRKPIVLFGLGVAAISSFAAVFTTQIGWFLVTRVLQGVGSAVCSGIGRSILADRCQDKVLAKLSSYCGMAVCMSPLFAPMVGGYLQHWFGWQANFLALGIYMLTSFVLFMIVVPETNMHRNPLAMSFNGLMSAYRYLLTHRLFLGAAFLSGIGLAATMIYASTSSFILQRGFHLTPVVYGWLTSLVSVGSLLGRFASARLVSYWGSIKCVLVAQYLLLFSGLWLVLLSVGHTASVALFLISILVVTFSQALTQGNTTALALSEFTNKRGMAGALYGGSQTLIAFAAAAIVSSMVGSVSVLAVGYVILGLLGLASCYLLVKRHR